MASAALKVAAALVALAACHAKAQPQITCEHAIAGLDAQLAPGKLAWFGEVHGTEESPRWVGDVACLAARAGKTQVGLEIPHDEQPAIDRYVASAGAPPDRDALLAGGFWNGYHDGRSSEAMLALIERVRALRAAGADIAIAAYDMPAAADRDGAMADEVVALRDSHAVFVALSGNIHSRRVKGAPWNPELVPTVAHLVERGLPVRTWNVAATGGTYWACIAKEPGGPQDCGSHPAGPGDPRDAGNAWTLGPSRDDKHDGIYRVGATKASPPAKP